jgi:hypothetical protein
MKAKNTLRDLYKSPGFRARTMLKTHPERLEYPNKTKPAVKPLMRNKKNRIEGKSCGA